MPDRQARGCYLNRSVLERFFASHPVNALLACSADSVFVASGHRTWLDEKMLGWMASPSGDETPRAGYAVVTAGGEIGLVANAVVRADAQARAPDCLMLFGRNQPHATPEAALAALLREMELAHKTIAWEEQALGGNVKQAIIEFAPACTFIDGSITWRLLKTVKSADAIGALREVSVVTERALDESLPLWRERADPFAARRRYMRVLAESGADFDHFAWGMRGGGVSVRVPPQERAGTLFFDAGARLDGFYSDTGLTLAHAPCSFTDAQRYADALGVLNVGRVHLRAGERASSAWQAMQDASPDTALVAQGHGLGTSIREWPFFGPATDRCVRDGIGEYGIDQTLVEGMVVNLEVAGHWPDGSSVQVEQTFNIEAEGARLLAAQPREHTINLAASPRS